MAIIHYIRKDDQIYVTQRIISQTATEEQAQEIKESIGAEVLIRDQEGKWYCCNKAQDAVFRDIDPNEIKETEEEFVPLQVNYGTYNPIDTVI